MTPPPAGSADHAYQTLLVRESEPRITTVTLNRPDRYNAMTAEMFGELELAAARLADDGGLRVVIVTGSGKGFCSGYDLAAAADLPGLGALAMLDLQERAARALLAVRELRVPVIAAVNGPAAGGGLALALAADIRIVAPEAVFSAAFVRVGLSAGDLGTSWMLTRLIGPGAASEICFTGRPVPAAEALRIGLVNTVSEPGALSEDALSLARAIAANSPGGVRLSKRAILRNQEITSYAAALELENRGQALLSTTQDMSEALAAYTECREPRFTGQ
jgi:enoyl-CoA hydratase/carnithine racemase